MEGRTVTENNNNLPAKRSFSYGQEVALEIMSQPNRGGYTFEQIAELAQISPKQLRRWRQSEVFQRELQKRTLLNLNEHLPKVVNVLKDQAIAGNIKAIELFLKSLGVLQERLLVATTNDVEFNSRTDERIKSDIDRLSKLLDDDTDDDVIEV